MINPLNKKSSLILGFFLCYHYCVCAQYKIKTTSDLGFGLGSGIGLSTALYLQHKTPALTSNQIQSLNLNNVNAFDRFACKQWHPQAAKTSDVIAIGSTAIYSYFFIDKQSRNDALIISTVGAQSVLLSTALSNVFKLSLRPRPYTYNSNVDMNTKLKPDARMSFFSSHTSTVSAMSFSFAYAYQTYHNDQKNLGIWLGAAGLPALQGYLRVRAGKHFPTDVITGYLIGLGSSWLMHRLHAH